MATLGLWGQTIEISGVPAGSKSKSAGIPIIQYTRRCEVSGFTVSEVPDASEKCGSRGTWVAAGDLEH